MILKFSFFTRLNFFIANQIACIDKLNEFIYLDLLLSDEKLREHYKVQIIK